MIIFMIFKQYQSSKDILTYTINVVQFNLYGWKGTKMKWVDDYHLSKCTFYKNKSTQLAQLLEQKNCSTKPLQINMV